MGEVVILSGMEDGKFSRYEIREVLGKGGMAEVYRAYDPFFDRDVALKILRREMLEEPRLRERFERETKIIAKLELEAIVPVYDIGHDKDQLFFVMRLMPGGTLAERILSGPIPLREVNRIIQRIAPALDGAHRKGIIHRDLKPGNILFDENNNPYISDFGIAKSISTRYQTLTEDGVVGTPRYMSPEQARGEPLDARSDIYSLGVIVYEMLVGKTRFDAFTPLGMAFRAEDSPVPRLPVSNPPFPGGLQQVLDKVLARDRDQRYSTNVEFANALSAVLEGQFTPTPRPATTLKPIKKPDKRRDWVSSLYWLAGAAVTMGMIAFAISKFSGAAAPVIPTPLPATATLTAAPPATERPVVPVALQATATLAETATVTATGTAPIDLGVGGADKIALAANNEIYVMDIDGGNLEPLTQTGIPKLDLQWLPDGSGLLYVEGKCVYTIDLKTGSRDPQQLLCLEEPDFRGFRLSPDGKRVAISVANRLMVLPYNLATLSTARKAFELHKLESLCLDYSDVDVSDALWSADGKMLAVRYQGMVYGQIGDTIRVIEGNWERCREVSVLAWDEFPADHFAPDGYTKIPLVPSYGWDGSQRFVLNSFVRNKNYGDLYLYDMSGESAQKLNPIDGNCCYGGAAFSPDGTHLLFVFQDVRLGSESENKLYYIPIDQIGTGTEFTPLRLPHLFFQNLNENIRMALHSAG